METSPTDYGVHRFLDHDVSCLTVPAVISLVHFLTSSHIGRYVVESVNLTNRAHCLEYCTPWHLRFGCCFKILAAKEAGLTSQDGRLDHTASSSKF